MNQENGIIVTQHIYVNNDRVMVRLRFENKGPHPRLVKEGLYGFGVRGVCVDGIAILDPEFFIRTEDTVLTYDGPIVHRSPFTIESFSPMMPGEVIERAYIRIDNMYGFLPGTHSYEILHYHFEYNSAQKQIFMTTSEPACFTYSLKKN